MSMNVCVYKQAICAHHYSMYFLEFIKLAPQWSAEIRCPIAKIFQHESAFLGPLVSGVETPSTLGATTQVTSGARKWIDVVAVNSQ